MIFGGINDIGAQRCNDHVADRHPAVIGHHPRDSAGKRRHQRKIILGLETVNYHRDIPDTITIIIGAGVVRPVISLLRRWVRPEIIAHTPIARLQCIAVVIDEIIVMENILAAAAFADAMENSLSGIILKMITKDFIRHRHDHIDALEIVHDPVTDYFAVVVMSRAGVRETDAVLRIVGEHIIADSIIIVINILRIVRILPETYPIGVRFECTSFDTITRGKEQVQADNVSDKPAELNRAVIALGQLDPGIPIAGAAVSDTEAADYHVIAADIDNIAAAGTIEDSIIPMLAE
jgi:hypothetical protein